MNPSTKKITTQQAMEAASIIYYWATNNPEVTRNNPKHLAEIASELFGALRAEQFETPSARSKGWPSKVALVEIMIDYCNRLPIDFYEAEFRIGDHVKSVGYSHAGISAKSILGEGWETDDGRKFCFVAQCQWDTNEEENCPTQYDYEKDEYRPKKQLKNGLDCTGIDFLDDYPEGTPWNEKCWTRVILRQVDESAPCYYWWNRELIHFEKASKLNSKKLKREFTRIFQMSEAAKAISEHSKAQ